ncbi:MAG: hypothetical protein AB7O62_24520 [Pirellulales bacterium]
MRMMETMLAWPVWRLAEAAPDLGNLTATAILGWYAWHTASRTLPALVAEFRAELAAARQACREERAVFFEALLQEREQRHGDRLALIAALRESAALRTKSP